MIAARNRHGILVVVIVVFILLVALETVVLAITGSEQSGRPPLKG